MKEYYECHITMIGDPAKIETAVEAVGWTFSRIDGDPTLGAGVKCYATKHFNLREGPVGRIAWMVDTLANGLETTCEVEVLRTKVELVVYDNRRK